jgi:hypothetical protein
MRTSREWIDKTVAELDDAPAQARSAAAPAAGPARREPARFELTLTPQEAEALDAICRHDELSPSQALVHIVRARLLDQPQFGRTDRARLRSCLELLRALEQHVGRAARPAGALRQTAVVMNTRSKELVELGVHLRRIGRAIGESMLGNLQYWRGELSAAPDAPGSADPEAPGPPDPRRDSSGSW